uniref:Omega-3 desaturase-like A n=2 Tax=Patella vulgata TaxID=6465 RepID=A0A2H4NNK1_PATVU|nr:omega-3 desaturase-like A [Patella vulgata]
MKIDEIEFQTTAAAETETANKADPKIPELTVTHACSDNSDPSIDNEQNGYIRHRSTTNGKQHESSVLNGNGTSHVKDTGKVDMLTAKLPTLSEIKAALPRHCFRPTVAESMYYVVKDMILVAAMFCLAQWLLGFKSYVLLALLTPIYWFAQGTLFFSIFVLGHDCNHGSFSSYALLNDCLGTVLHTLVMTPYYPWKLSHRHHHNNTGNMDKDEIFYPVREKDNNKNSFLPLFGLGFGWMAYLWKGFGPRPMNHWIPSHPIFARHLLGCALSIASIALWLVCLYFYASKMGLGNLLYHYAVPVFICGCYIVVVTFLHHSDLELPWYGENSWDNVRGKLSSVDRDYGMIHDVIHTIGTHQVHHLFPVIPHYHLREATKHFRKAFPQLVHIRNTPILPAFWEMFFKYTSQSIVANDAKIHYYK